MMTTASVSVSLISGLLVHADSRKAFKPNSTNILVSNLWCNGSHGVSVGSLGQVCYPLHLPDTTAYAETLRMQYAGETDIVANVTVFNVSMNNAQNGARIKVFGGNPDPST